MISEHEPAFLGCTTPSACIPVQTPHSSASRKVEAQVRSKFAMLFTCYIKYIFKVLVLLFQIFVAFLFGIGREMCREVACVNSLNNVLFVRLPLLRAANVQNHSKTPTAPSFWFSLWTVWQTGRAESDWMHMLKDLWPQH